MVFRPETKCWIYCSLSHFFSKYISSVLYPNKNHPKLIKEKNISFNAHLTLSEGEGGKVSQGQCMYGIGYTLGIFGCRHRSKDAEVEVIG